MWRRLAQEMPNRLVSKYFFILSFGLWGYWHCGHSWPIVPASGDSEDDCGEADVMYIGRGNRSSRRKPAPAPLLSITKFPHDQTRVITRAAAVGSRRLTAWSMARPRSPSNAEFRRYWVHILAQVLRRFLSPYRQMLRYVLHRIGHDRLHPILWNLLIALNSIYHKEGLTVWPPCSPDLNPLNFGLWGSLESPFHRNIVNACQTVHSYAGIFEWFRRAQACIVSWRTFRALLVYAYFEYCEQERKRFCIQFITNESVFSFWYAELAPNICPHISNPSTLSNIRWETKPR
jgi:hypothetical protein